MKKYILPIFASCFALTSAQAGQTVLGMNFVVSHPTTISAIGAFDAGNPFTSYETVGVFSDLTGTLVGSEAVFGPGHAGSQVGNTFYETVPSFMLSPGDYSIISVSTGGSLPKGGGFSPYDWDSRGQLISLSEGSGIASLSQPLVLVDPPSNGNVPDGGLTVMLLGVSLAGLGSVRRKF